MNDEKTQGFIDPETGESDTVTFPTEVNGWEYDPDKRGAAIAWVHPEDSGTYVGWEKTGGHTWSAWISRPDMIPRDTVYNSFGSPEEALEDAKRLMKKYSPEDVAQMDSKEDW